MPSTIEGRELERTMREWIHALSRLTKRDRAEADELIGRLRTALKNIRPDWFGLPAPPKEPQP